MERRVRRSHYRGLALRHFLDAISMRRQAHGMIIAESSGLLIASNLADEEAELYAALCPFIAQGITVQRSAKTPYPIHVETAEVDGVPFYICVVGHNDAALKEARPGIERILQARHEGTISL
jgi:predicted regulator of Ras-like GTPase activity (Roadblock/LC7/MglB family)